MVLTNVEGGVYSPIAFFSYGLQLVTQSWLELAYLECANQSYIAEYGALDPQLAPLQHQPLLAHGFLKAPSSFSGCQVTSTIP